MAERKIDPKFNIHPNYNRVNIVNPYRFEGGAGATTPQEGVVAHWNYNELSGNLIDSINGHNGTLTGTFDRTGEYYVFNGTNTSINVPYSNDFNFLGAFTIRMKIRFNNLTSSNGHWIINKLNAGSTCNFEISIIGGFLRIYIDGTSNVIQARVPVTSLSTGVDYHLVARYDGSANQTGLKLFINKSTELMESQSSLALGTPNISTNPIVIGDAAFGSTRRRLNGRIYDMRIHKGYAWTQSDIDNDFTAIM